MRLLNGIRRIFSSFRSALLIMRVEGLLERENYKEALDTIKRIDRKGGMRTEIEIRYIYILIAIGEYRDAYIKSEELVIGLQKNNEIEHEENFYLKTYTQWIAQDCFRVLYNNDQTSVPDWIVIDWSRVNLENVSKTIKRKFPLRAHPLWKEP